MSSDVAIRAVGLGKSYAVYEKPHHRLFQMVFGSGRKWHREFHALRGIDLEVRRGETVGIVGKNGSGKSTLLQLICGTLSPTTGHCEVRGRVAALLELGAGFNPEFTGRENVFLNASILGMDKAQTEDRYGSIVEFADIGEFIEHPVKTYSSGMFVRLAFAVAIHVQPEILVIDEALAVGDEGFQRKCYRRINEIRDAGATVLFVSHSPASVVELCDRAVLLDAGALIATGSPKDVITQYQKLLFTGDASRRTAEGEETRKAKPAEADGENASVRDADSHAFFDPSLTCRGIEYEERGARITDLHLETMAGRRVNVLCAGGSYEVVYRIELLKPLSGLRFGTMIRTATGVELAGCVSTDVAGAEDVLEAGTGVDVRLRFTCNLFPAPYFLTAGVFAMFEEGERFAHRLVDACAFRVMRIEPTAATGMVDLLFQPNASLSDGGE